MLCNENTMLQLISNHTGIWVIFLFYGLSSCHTKNWGECFLEKYKKSLQSRFVLFLFHDLQVPSWNIKSSLSFGLESSISRNIRNFLRAVFLFSIFWARKFPSWNIRRYEAGKFHIRIYKTFFCCRVFSFFRAGA